MKAGEIIRMAETTSTSDTLRRMADEGKIDAWPVALRADFQSRGRGQVGNSWESEEGKNLLISIYAKPAGVSIERQFIVSMTVALAGAETVCEFLPEDKRRLVKIKWPNDIYVGDGKISGILVENRLRGRDIADCIVGVGLNVNQEVFRSKAPNPVSLWQLKGEETAIDEAAEALMRNMTTRLSMADDGMDAEICREYWARLYRADGAMHLFADKGGRFMAKIVGVATDGRFTLEREDGERSTYLFKEVEHVVRTKEGDEVTPNLEVE